MIHFRQSIGFRLLVVSFILLALPLLVDSFILVQMHYRHTIEDAQASLVESAHLREFPLSQLNPLNSPLLMLLIDYLELESHFPRQANQRINDELNRLANIGNFFGIYLFNITPENGYIVVASSDPQLIGKDYTKFFKLNDLYASDAVQRGFASYMVIDNKNLHPYFIVARPVYNMKDSKYDGILAISDDIFLKVDNLLKPEIHNYTINFAILLSSTLVFEATDPELRFQYFLPLSKEYKELLLQENFMAGQDLPNKPLPVKNTENSPFFEFTWKNQDQIGYIKKLPNANYSLLAYAAKNEVFHTPFSEFFNIYISYGVILIFGGLAAIFTTMRMAKPIQNLGLVMQKMQTGEVDLRYRKDPVGFEINTLGEVFNEMVDALLVQKHVAEEERIKKESFARELQLGQRVQRSLLPQKMPQYPGVEMAEIYIPTIEVGGDFYDVFIQAENAQNPKLVLAIADVSGKGVQACFYSLSIKNMLRTYIKECVDIAQAMSATNDLFRLDTEDSGLFVTVLCGIYDYQTHLLSYYSCGHNPGLVLRNNGAIELLESKGIAMGVFPMQNAQASLIQLQKGDVIVLYTDGITEAHNANFELFGEERLIDCLKKEKFKTAAEIVESIVAQVKDFAYPAPQHDDITLLVMRVMS